MATDIWVARASRVLVSVSHRNDLLLRKAAEKEKSATARTPSPARETRALPILSVCRAFTGIELLIVMAIILVLAGLILATSGYVQKKGARSRTEAEIAAMSAALENYKADNGVYPTDVTATESVNPTSSPVPQTASKFLYAELTGDRDYDGSPDAGTKSYLTFKPASVQRQNMSQPIGAGNAAIALRDPFGNAYGYSTAKAKNPIGTIGYNPTFDLWSTAATDGTAPSDQAQWIKNW